MARNFALTIGVNEYEYERDLNFAVNDAIAMETYFQNIGFEEVLRYSNHPQDRPPELVSLRKGIRWISSQLLLGPEDSFWFFFSGHGGRQNGRDFLLPTNADPEDLVRSAITVDEVVRALRECKAGNLVLVLDACRNRVQNRSRSLGNQTVELVKQAGIITLFSCSPGEMSYELPEYEQGAFTYTLLQALKGDYAPNQCNALQLSDYLQQEVPVLTQELGSQVPYVVAEPIRKATQMLLPQPMVHPSPSSSAQEQAATSEHSPQINADKLKADALHARYVLQDLDQAKILWKQLLYSPASSTDDKDLAYGQLRELEAAQQTPESRLFSSSDTRQQPSIPASPPEPPSSPNRSLTTFSFETVQVNGKGKIIKRISKEAQYFTEDLGGGVTFDMVKIEGGSFDMGSNDYDSEKPIHRVTVPSFYVGKFVVTQAAYEKVTGENPATDSDHDRFVDPNKPIINVSWQDAIVFCEKLSERTGNDYRLPSEAEWEYACRAGTTTPFHFGPTLTTAIANYDGNSAYGNGPKGEYRKQTTPVGSFPPNAFGLYDMHGNVWEWCADYWHESYEGAPSDGSAWLENTLQSNNGRVIRGGSWADDPGVCRSAYRYHFTPGFRCNALGFRVVLAPQ